MTQREPQPDLRSSLFAHPAERYWWDDPDDPRDWTGAPDSLMLQATQFFRNPVAFAEGLSENQLAEGLDCLISSSGEALLWRIADLAMPWEVGRPCLQSFPSLFLKLFAPRCGESAVTRLETVCFMWWDAADCYAKQAGQPQFDAEALSAMQAILAIPSAACRNVSTRMRQLAQVLQRTNEVAAAGFAAIERR